MKEVIEILSVEKREGIGKKSQSAYSMIVCQCVLHSEKGVAVGEMILPKDFIEPKPGRYIPRYESAVDFDKRLGARLVELLPAASAANVKAA